jgi:Zn finger protein HypA/HybF involved in hydrogenase expression
MMILPAGGYATAARDFIATVFVRLLLIITGAKMVRCRGCQFPMAADEVVYFVLNHCPNCGGDKLELVR